MSGVIKKLNKLMEKAFCNQSLIKTIERINEHFIYIEIEGDELKGARVEISDYFQIIMGDLQPRSYTPMVWDTKLGIVKFIVYMHGNGLAKDWFDKAQIGDECVIMGPKKSINTKKLKNSLCLIGDETSIGLVIKFGLLSIYEGDLRTMLEVENVQAVQQVLDRFGTKAELYKNGVGGSGSNLLEDAMDNITQASILLTGNGRKISKLREILKKKKLHKKIQRVIFWTTGKAQN